MFHQEILNYKNSYFHNNMMKHGSQRYFATMFQCSIDYIIAVNICFYRLVTQHRTNNVCPEAIFEGD